MNEKDKLIIPKYERDVTYGKDNDSSKSVRDFMKPTTEEIEYLGRVFQLKQELSAIYLNKYTMQLFENDRLIVDSSFQIFFSGKELILKSILTLREQGRGFGSLVMKKIIQKAEKLNLDRITGFISPEDIQTKELKDHVYGFYKKHGAYIEKDRFYIPIRKNHGIER